MHRFNTAYTVYFNRRHERRGHLFQGRYKAILIDADRYLLELSRYIHLNPVRIKTYSQDDVKKKRKIVKGYSRSSYRGYINLRSRHPFVIYSKILSMAGGADDREGRRRYQGFVMGGISEDMRVTLWEGVKGQVLLGSETFVIRIYERFLSRKVANERAFSRLKEIRP